MFLVKRQWHSNLQWRWISSLWPNDGKYKSSNDNDGMTVTDGTMGMGIGTKPLAQTIRSGGHLYWNKYDFSKLKRLAIYTNKFETTIYYQQRLTMMDPLLATQWCYSLLWFRYPALNGVLCLSSNLQRPWRRHINQQAPDSIGRRFPWLGRGSLITSKLTRQSTTNHAINAQCFEMGGAWPKCPLHNLQRRSTMHIFRCFIPLIQWTNMLVWGVFHLIKSSLKSCST